MSDMTPQKLTALKLKFYDALVCDPDLLVTDLRIAWLLLSRYLNSKSLVACPNHALKTSLRRSPSYPMRRRSPGEGGVKSRQPGVWRPVYQSRVHARGFGNTFSALLLAWPLFVDITEV